MYTQCDVLFLFVSGIIGAIGFHVMFGLLL